MSYDHWVYCLSNSFVGSDSTSLSGTVEKWALPIQISPSEFLNIIIYPLPWFYDPQKYQPASVSFNRIDRGWKCIYQYFEIGKIDVSWKFDLGIFILKVGESGWSSSLAKYVNLLTIINEKLKQFVTTTNDIMLFYQTNPIPFHILLVPFLLFRMVLIAVYHCTLFLVYSV